jgi:hypothetical protein
LVVGLGAGRRDGGEAELDGIPGHEFDQGELGCLWAVEFGFEAGLEKDRWVFAEGIDGKVKGGVLELRGEAVEADEPRAAIGEVVVEEMGVGGEAGDVAGIADAEEAAFG